MEYELIEPDQTHDAGVFMSYARGRQTAKAERDPEVGDVVHFWHAGLAECQAAMVLKIFDLIGGEYAVTLKVSAEDKDHRERMVKHDEAKAGGSWHWPCGGH